MALVATRRAEGRRSFFRSSQSHNAIVYRLGCVPRFSSRILLPIIWHMSVVGSATSDEKGNLKVEANGTTVVAASVKIDPAMTPKTIDFRFTEGQLKDMSENCEPCL